MRKLILAALLAASLAAPAQAAEVSLPREEVEALKLGMIGAKPNVATVTIASFVFPGSAQAYMGKVDRTMALWGSYLLGYTVAKVAVPDSLQTAGIRVSDLAVLGLFMGLAAVSAVDAYGLAVAQRTEYDRLINRLDDRMTGIPPAQLLPVRPSP